jgi:hypothetical protein
MSGWPCALRVRESRRTPRDFTKNVKMPTACAVGIFRHCSFFGTQSRGSVNVLFVSRASSARLAGIPDTLGDRLVLARSSLCS